MQQGDFSRVARVAVPVPLPGLFDYLPPAGDLKLCPGQRVEVPFGPRQMVGVVIELAQDSAVPAHKLQAIVRILDNGDPLLPGDLLKLLRWCWRYYKHPCGEVVFNALPPAMRKVAGQLPEPPVQYRLTAAGQARLSVPPGRETAQYRVLEALQPAPLSIESLRALLKVPAQRLRMLMDKGWLATEPLGETLPAPTAGPVLTAEQHTAVTAITATPPGYQCHLLEGITGSGKTEVYLRLLEPLLASGRQVLVLVPEIGLTPQLLRRFRDRLGTEPMASHSGLSQGERLRVWAAAASGRARLLIGTRSALFLPLFNPGMIIMDESHDASFKQQDGFRYSARDVAIKRAADLEIPIVLGTATPSLESLHNAARERFAHHRLTVRATGAPQPRWQVVDLKRERTRGGVSEAALSAMHETLQRDEQVLVFLNRRGYAPVMLCHECGWFAGCGRCDSNLTWHRSARRLICHHCEEQLAVPQFCPECRADALEGAGEGTEQLEQTLVEHFQGVPVYRVDRDRMRRKGALERTVAEVRKGEPCLLVGTQMLAKGHHFPRVTLVVVINLDQALYSADYRAMERMGQTLVQVAGRAGREDRPGTVVLQTHHPEHEVLGILLQHGYHVFAQHLLKERELAQLPPFAFQAVLRADGPDKGDVQRWLAQAKTSWPGEAAELFGPFPAMMERRAGRLRWYLLVHCQSRPRLQALLDAWLSEVRAQKTARHLRWAVDMDPQEF